MPSVPDISIVQIELSQAAVAPSWLLQAALRAGLCVASAVLAMTFRRPVMRTLTAFFAVSMVASLVVWAVFAGDVLGLAPVTAPIGAALSIALGPGIAGALLLHMVRIIAGSETGAWPTWAVSLLWAAVAGAGAYVMAFLTEPAAGATVGRIGTIGSVISCGTFLTIGVYAWYVGREQPGRTTVFRLLIAALAFLGIRSSINLALGGLALSAGEELAFPPLATGAQVFLLAISGVLLLVAALDEERARAVQHAEQLRAAELAVATSRRMESLGQMAGAVAHDFNNVLTVISVSTEVARAAPGEPHEDELRDIHEAAQRGQALTKQLVAFARSAPRTIVRFDAAARTRELSALLQRMAGQGVALDVVADGAAQPVEMDVTQFEQVLMNLVANARDAAALGGHVRVEVGPASQRPNGAFADDAAFVRVTVMDNGSGIMPDVLPHIFEPFYTTKRPGQGSGLGLATCERIVRAVGGRIEVHSDAAAGTRFDVLLPKAKATEV